MKEKEAMKLLRGMADIGDDLVEEAGAARKRGKTASWRWGAIAACLCLALVGTAGAVNVIVRQSRTYLINSEEEKWDVIESVLESAAGDGNGPEAVVVAGGFNSAYEYSTDVDGFEDWWNAYGLTPLEEIEGTEEDGWKQMRKFQREGYLEQRYWGETISDFTGLWGGTSINPSWLEAHYTAVPGTQRAYMKFLAEQEKGFSFTGAFQGPGGAAFTVEVIRNDRPFADTTFQMTTGYDHTELYQTSDEVEVLIEMGTNDSGKSVFWADFTSGCNNFGMWGTQLELDDLHDILDSLNLSALLEYAAE